MFESRWLTETEVLLYCSQMATRMNPSRSATFHHWVASKNTLSVWLLPGHTNTTGALVRHRRRADRGT